MTTEPTREHAQVTMSEFETLTKEGSELAAKGHHAAAREKLAEACRLMPADASAWSNLGGVSFLSGDHQEAEKAYGKALALDPALSEAILGLARISIARGDTAAARSHLARLERTHSGVGQAQSSYLQGILHELEGKPDDALTAYRTASEKGDQQAGKALCKLLVRLDRPEDLADFLSSSTELEPGKKTSPLLLLSVLKALPSGKSRWRFAEKILAADPANPFLHDLMASGFLHLHDFAYAALVAALARRNINDLDPARWKTLKECAWF